MSEGRGPGEPPVHVPVMCREVIELLAPRTGGIYLDATVGGGGHTAAILERIGPQGLLLGVDRDAEALELARHRLGDDPRLRLFHLDFRDLDRVVEKAGAGPLDGIVADLGISSIQLEGRHRGFSFRRDEELDMRMDRSTGKTAAEWLEEQDMGSLRRALRDYGEEIRWGSRIARAIVNRRESHGPIRTTGELAAVVRSAVPRRGPTRIDPATRTFQAIRIAVNDELRGLGKFVDDAIEALGPEGRLAVISFHSLEDREVKAAFRRLAGQCLCPRDMPICGCGRVERIRPLTRRPRRPGEDELMANPRARSARLRAAERLADPPAGPQ